MTIKKIFPLAPLLCGVAAVLWMGNVQAEEIDLGTASHYSAFILGDTTAIARVGGRLAVAGNLDTAKLDLAIDLPRVDVPSDLALVVGRDIKRYGDGRIWNKAHGTYANNATNLTPWLLVHKAASVIDFDADRAWLTMLAAQLAARPATGTVAMVETTVTLTGTQADVEVFQLAPDQVVTGKVLILNNVKPGAHLILNMRSDAQRIVRLQWNQAALQVHRARVLFNFPDAEQVLFDTATVWGSMLAPHGCMKSNGGVVNGTVVASTWNGTTEIKYAPFTPLQ